MKLELLDFIELDNYPSGSGIEFYNDRIYIVGDDSRDLLVMTKKWSKPTLINLFETAEKRIPKAIKSDLEAMTVLAVDKKPHLLVIGSGATDKRNKALLLNLKNNAIQWIDLTVFYNRIKAAGITDLNIEGIAEINENGRLALDKIQVISDDGSHVLYDDGVEAKNISPASLKKFRSVVLNAGSMVLGK